MTLTVQCEMRKEKGVGPRIYKVNETVKGEKHPSFSVWMSKNKLDYVQGGEVKVSLC